MKSRILFTIFCFSVAVLSAQINSSSFATRMDITSGSGSGVGRGATGDFNNDGKPDILMANISANTISVFANNSSGGVISFAPKLDILVSGNGPETIATGDFDGDGKIDFAVADGGSTSTIIEIFKNTSNGSVLSFANSITFTVGTVPKGIVAKDFDGDGKLDIATSNYSSNSISILRNTSSGGSLTFNLKVDYSLGNSPILLISNDFDGDGKFDIAWSNYVTNGTITILKNLSTNGNLLFSNWGSLTTGSFPNFLGSTDLDGDLRPELFNVNYSNNNFNIFRNISTSSLMNFTVAETFITGTSSTQPQGISASDFDGDGKKDIVTTNSNGGYISVFKNTATAGIINASSFAAPVSFSAPLTANFGIETVDFNLDNRIDILITNSGLGSFSIYKNETPRTNINNAIMSNNFVSLYPLPLENILNIKTNLEDNIINTSIYDLFGKEIITSNSLTIDVSGLKSGAYLAKITSNKGVYYEKITK
ncbi:MAG: T9SS type A sorting domain-containing protein [Bacteroidia bacterium]|nr:T9SS type A sorting domain-containing protein [Bacteroidia bacterium]